MMFVDDKRPLLMIKAIENISKSNEILTHYGDDFKSMLQSKGGCRCVECIDQKNECKLRTILRFLMIRIIELTLDRITN